MPLSLLKWERLPLGGNVRKGEHGTTVFYADRFVPEDEKQRARDTGEDAQAIPFLKRFTVFNVAQCEGLPEHIAVAVPPPLPGVIEPTVEALIKATGIDFRIIVSPDCSPEVIAATNWAGLISYPGVLTRFQLDMSNSGVKSAAFGWA